MLSSRLGRSHRLGCLVVLTFAAHTVAAVPDRINIPKFKKIYETKTQLSFEARTEANGKQDTLLEKRRVRQHLQAQQQQKVWRIEQNKTSVTALRKNNESLNQTSLDAQAQIQNNGTTRQNLLTQINSLSTAIGQKETQRDNQTIQWKRAQSLLDTEQANWKETKEDLRLSREDLATATNDWNAAQDRVVFLRDEIAKFRQELRQVSSDKAAYEDEMQNGVSKKQTLAADLQSALDEVDRIRRALDDANNRLALLQKVIDDSEFDFQDADGKLTHVTNRLQNLRQEKRQLGNTISSLDSDVAKLTQEVGLLDIEKLRLEETIPLLEAEVTKVQDDLKVASTRVKKLTKDLENAKDEDEKKQIAQQLKQAENREATLDANFKEKRQEVNQSRKALLDIPAKKTTKRVALLKVETDKTNQENALVQVEAQLENTQDRKQILEKHKNDATQDKNRAAGRHQIVTNERDALIGQAKTADDQVKSLEQAGRRLNRRQKLVVELLAAVNKSYRILDLEAIPQLQQSLSNTQNEVAALDGRVRKLTQDERQLERDVQQSATNVANAQGDLNREQSQLSQIQSQLLGLQNQQSAAVSRRAELLTENQGLTDKINNLQQSIQDQNQTINTLIASNFALQKDADDLERNIFTAETAESVAEGVFQLADATATRLESDRDASKSVFDQTVANYESEKTSAIAEASFAAIAHGGREGTERGTADGGPLGTRDGKAAGTAEGTTEGEQRDYAAAYALAHQTKLPATIATKALETTAQKTLRESTPALQVAFGKGKGRGEIQGRKDGIAAGDNSTQEKAGHDAGYALGKRQAEDRAELTHRPLGQTQREQEILNANPKNTEDRDTEKDEIGPGELSALERSWNLLVDWALPSASADGKLGDITENEVPAVQFTYRKLVTGHDHPDFDSAYAATYNKVYQKTYVDQYRSSYKATYVGTYTAAFDAAKTAALNVEYTQKKNQGTQDGEAAGLFEGLGYNGGYASLYPVGKAAGEQTAFDRGKKAGTPKGYSENIQNAEQNALAAGRKDTDSRYQNNVQLQLVENTVALRDEDGDGKFSVGDTLRLDAKLRNFGGVGAAAGSTEIKVTSSRGVKFMANPVPLGELAAETQFAYSNLLVGEIEPAGEIAIRADVLWKGTKVGTFSVTQEVYAPFQVTYTYFYDSKADLRVGGVNNGTGYHNAVWVKALPGASTQNLQISMQPEDTSVAQFSWEGGVGMNDWNTLSGTPNQGWIRMGFFLRASKYQGLKENKFRVRLRDRGGRILMDKLVDAPIEVK